MQETLTFLLAGGVGSRLSPLTDDRAKPAVPFGGKYRIIDFTLTNCLHSGLRRILVLTQYKSHSLQKHLRDGWSFFNTELNEYISVIPPQMRKGDKWYEGTADALFHNLWLLTRSNAKNVIVLSGDHIYRMDYSAMLEKHKANNAFLTVACMKVPRENATAFGVMDIDKDNRIVSFIEKPKHPPSIPSEPNSSLVSMGIYIFDAEALQQALREDAQVEVSSHDFGKDIIPQLIPTERVYAYPFGHNEGRVDKDRYWRDVGTLDSYYEANMDLLNPVPPLNLYQSDWPIRTYEPQLPPSRTVASATGNEGIFVNSIIANGVINSGGSVLHSIISPSVRIHDRATVTDSILFNDVNVGEGCQIAKCIVDKHVNIPPNTKIGFDHAEDAKKFKVSEKGVVVIPEGYQFKQ